MNKTEIQSEMQNRNGASVSLRPAVFVPPPSEELLKALAEERFLERTGDEQTQLVAADYFAGYDLIGTPALAEHDGQFVAILKGQFVGAGNDYGDLNDLVALTYHVHPNRPALIHFCNGTCR
jgi:hypothetical protein